jgi:hypothetical protein
VSTEFTITALLSTHNDENIIGQAVEHLIAQGIRVHLVDEGSTDETIREAERFATNDWLTIESAPAPTTDDEPRARHRVLRRQEELAGELTSTWFIHQDADEFRESAWTHLSLADGIRLVDGLDYNAIDFAILNFPQTHDGFRRGDDVRESFPFCQAAPSIDTLQVTCWKRQPAPVHFASSGGHDVVFPNRRVFPLRFLGRRYQTRSQAHGVRCDEATLTRFDPDRVRVALQLRHRNVEALEQELAASRQVARGLGSALRSRTAELDALAQRVQALSRPVLSESNGGEPGIRRVEDLPTRYQPAAQQQHVDAHAATKDSALTGEDCRAPFAWVDAPAMDATVTREVVLRGWVVNDVDIAELRVFLDDQGWLRTPLNEPRPDVSSMYPHYTHGSDEHGWHLTARLPDSAGDGEHVFRFQAVDMNGRIKDVTSVRVHVNGAHRDR